ncbi:MAG: putrescine ABC transporter permease PotI [Lysobacterales bacterium]|jgi:putrescine transport system permease protein|nr:MAG: putrescine ABC transporter permease PotI [Xanthomonadales bacterium]
MRGIRPFTATALILGLLFLYLPILWVVLLSFNESRLLTRFEGFSLRWYQALFSDPALLAALGRSLLIALAAGVIAVIIGTLAATALARFPRFRGRALLAFLSSAPLVLPEVMLGFGALILFVSLERLIGWPAGRGMMTIILAHTLLAAAYVTVIVQSRLAGRERVLEEAAMDLGADPLRAYLLVTLPSIAPALIAGFLIAFTLSLDDLVIASFTAGPGATTLPMAIYSKLKLGLSPEINALATLLVLTAALAVSIAAWSLARRR